MQAESEEKKAEWISVLQNATADLLNSQNLSKPSKYSSSGSSTPETRSEPSITPLQQLRSIDPMNQICADCGAEGQPFMSNCPANSLADPEWCTINSGVLICIECSGAHRSLGVHISKVRSFTLDKWEPDVVKVEFRLYFLTV